MAHARDFQNCHGKKYDLVGGPGQGRIALISIGRQGKGHLVSPAPLKFRSPGALALQIIVRDNNIDQALKALKKKMQREGIFREMKLRGAYEKPSEKRARERAEAVRRYRKLQRKRMQREGLIPR
jgi:small subunit ribosomal protein S21